MGGGGMGYGAMFPVLDSHRRPTFCRAVTLRKIPDTRQAAQQSSDCCPVLLQLTVLWVCDQWTVKPRPHSAAWNPCGVHTDHVVRTSDDSRRPPFSVVHAPRPPNSHVYLHTQRHIVDTPLTVQTSNWQVDITVDLRAVRSANGVFSNAHRSDRFRSRFRTLPLCDARRMMIRCSLATDPLTQGRK